MNRGFRGRDVISILDFSRDELEELFDAAEKMEKLGSRARLLEGWVVALAFFEPSTRTRLSFESAAQRLGAGTIGFSGAEGTSVAKGETLSDTVRMLDSYADIIVMRHKYEGAALLAAEIAEHPVINGGDGRQHHPTQAMIDLYTVKKLFGGIDGLSYAVVGDLKHGRAASSFILGLTLFEPRHVYLVSPPSLRARPEVLLALHSRSVEYSEHERLEDIIGEVDIVYMTRIQKERFRDPSEYERLKGSYRITPELVEEAGRDLRILHPLPRVDEIDKKLDETPYAAYFQQAANGIPLRMALLALIAGVEP